MRRRSAFTVLELIIVAGLLAFLAVLLARAWRAVGQPTVALIVRSRLAQEANLAVAALQRDLGGSLAGNAGRAGEKGECKLVGRLQPENQQLWLCFDGGTSPNGLPDWAAPDTVIVYQEEDGKLVRWDQTAGTSFTVARHFQELELLDLGNRVEIRLTFSYRGVNRTYTLTACDP